MNQSNPIKDWNVQPLHLYVDGKVVYTGSSHNASGSRESEVSKSCVPRTGCTFFGVPDNNYKATSNMEDKQVKVKNTGRIMRSNNAVE